MDDYQKKARENLLKEQQERLDKIRELDIELARLYEDLFRLKVKLNSLEKQRKALKTVYKYAHPYLWKGWDVT